MSPLSQVKKSLISLRFLFNSEKDSGWLKKTSSKLSLSSPTTLGFTQSFSSPKHFMHIKAVNACSALVSKVHYSHPLHPKRINVFSSAVSPADWLNADLTYGPGGATQQCSLIAILLLPSHFVAQPLLSPQHTPRTHQRKDPLSRYFIYSFLPTNSGENCLAHPINLHRQK